MKVANLLGSGRRALAFTVVGWCLTAAAFAADDTPKPDKSTYTLFNPTPDDQLRDFNADRPARVTGPYTVDAGHFQIESDFLNFTFDREPGTITRSYQAADPVLKLGLTNTIDFEVALGGYNNIRTVDDTTHATLLRGNGFGDITLQAKINLLGDDGGTIAFAIEPYLRVPTFTRNVSAGQVEGGVLAPVQFNLPSDFALTLQSELDALANENGPGTHLNVTDIASLSHPVPGIKNLTGTVELYSSLDFERHTADNYTFDVALSYQVDKNTEVDAGLNAGLNRGTPDYQAYSGVAHRF